MNPWEVCALEYRYVDSTTTKNSKQLQYVQTKTTSDPLIYPGLYCPSGLDIMTVLFRVYARPNPQINLGPIDCSVCMIVCDLAQPDNPIVYASDAFLDMTGYRMDEIQGKNCRFLQAPGGKVAAKSTRQYVDSKTTRGMHEAIKGNKEHRVTLTNFTKAGRAFVNILSLIPIAWDSPGFRYSVGFQCDQESLAAAR